MAASLVELGDEPRSTAKRWCVQGALFPLPAAELEHACVEMTGLDSSLFSAGTGALAQTGPDVEDAWRERRVGFPAQWMSFYLETLQLKDAAVHGAVVDDGDDARVHSAHRPCTSIQVRWPSQQLRRCRTCRRKLCARQREEASVLIVSSSRSDRAAQRPAAERLFGRDIVHGGFDLVPNRESESIFDAAVPF
jgi:hypothetical protein